MCGICGYVAKEQITLANLKIMNDSMAHRGPDDSGEDVFPSGGRWIGLAQRRLSILDLSKQAHQPMYAGGDSVVIVFNGEIYNFNEIKEEIGDYTYRSTGDTEVILAAFLKWGIDSIKKFNGMFALAIYDKRDDVLYLARDKAGKKPLYYWRKDEDLVFASELKPIMLHPSFKKEIRTDVLRRYLLQQYITAPDTIFKDVYKLRPGELLTLKNGEIKTELHWNLFDVYEKNAKNPVTDYNEAKSTLSGLLEKAVNYRMISDVPLGAFLSGGYDSSLITALAQKNSSTPIKTYSIGFHEEKYNEAGHAKKVSQHLGTDHTELYVGEEDMFDMVDSIATYFDEPFADSSQIPTMLVSKLAKKDVTVVLSGDGGDEFFCGYNIYDNILLAQRLDPIGQMIHSAFQLPLLKQMNLIEKLPSKVRTIVRNSDKNIKTQFVSSYYLNAIRSMVPEGLCERYDIEKTIPSKNWQVRRMLLDMTHYLPDDILCKVDRATMKYSLEARCPILDANVMEYSFRIPHKFKYQNGDKKHILKQIAYDYIPKELLDRPKVGFAVPLDKWLRTLLKDRLVAFSRAHLLKEQGIFEPAYTQNLVDSFISTEDEKAGHGPKYQGLIWAFFVFQLWYNEYISIV